MPPDEDGMDQVSDLSDEDAQIKEVFARFGLAVYISQVFEQGLINLLMISSYGIDVVTLEQRDDLEERLRRQTTGALFAQLRKKNVLSRQEAELCQRAMVERNRLVHRFFFSMPTISLAQQENKPCLRRPIARE